MEDFFAFLVGIGIIALLIYFIVDAWEFISYGLMCVAIPFLILFIAYGIFHDN